jgi:hypothetical protein
MMGRIAMLLCIWEVLNSPLPLEIDIMTELFSSFLEVLHAGTGISFRIGLWSCPSTYFGLIMH